MRESRNSWNTTVDHVSCNSTTALISHRRRVLTLKFISCPQGTTEKIREMCNLWNDSSCKCCQNILIWESLDKGSFFFTLHRAIPRFQWRPGFFRVREYPSSTPYILKLRVSWLSLWSSWCIPSHHRAKRQKSSLKTAIEFTIPVLNLPRHLSFGIKESRTSDFWILQF